MTHERIDRCEVLHCEHAKREIEQSIQGNSPFSFAQFDFQWLTAFQNHVEKTSRPISLHKLTLFIQKNTVKIAMITSLLHNSCYF